VAVVTFCDRGFERRGTSPPPVLSESTESVEKKRVEVLFRAKNCKGIHKNLERKGLAFGSPVPGPLSRNRGTVCGEARLDPRNHSKY